MDLDPGALEAALDAYAVGSDRFPDDMARAIRAYLSASGSGSAGWRDMSSAPRDGTRFWGRVEDDAIAMLWHDGFQAFVSGWRCMEMAPGYTIDGQSFKDHSPFTHYPTGWLPLPTEVSNHG